MNHVLVISSLNSRQICYCCSVAQPCPTLCDPMCWSTPASPVLHYLPELAQIQVHWVSDAIQPSHPLLSLFPPAFNLSQHQGLFQWVGSLHQVAKVLELQLQHQSFHRAFRVDFPWDWLVWSKCPRALRLILDSSLQTSYSGHWYSQKRCFYSLLFTGILYQIWELILY